MVVVTLVLCMLLTLAQRNVAVLIQRLTNEQTNVALTIIASVVPTLCQRLAYGWLTVAVQAGTC